MRRAWKIAGLLAIVLTFMAGQPAGAGSAAAADTTKDTRQRSVTLITGDRVLVRSDTGSIRTVPGKGREHITFTVRQIGGQRYVVPSDALPMLASGALDRRLFDVNGLIELRYDDSHRSDLPLIVRTRQNLATGLRVDQRLSKLDVAAVRAGKDGRFWEQTRTDKTAKVWLDGARKPLLDRSVAHIGGPVAWAAGYTGTGVTVAVLDSGIDATHPDLAGQVVAAKNFTEDSNNADTTGHGTHVASIIAGTGAASAGRYRGVAPGAKLLDGKVCGDFFCSESGILAAMEWAAAEQHATVVNISIGGPDEAGVDPLEEAVNRLTATYGTLFVIAAGNSPSGLQKVMSPGSAEAALTVGAADLADNLADFSCVGPTADGALKPDITAPGVDIAAARVAGTPLGDADPVDEHYARSSGTSMATPHVAGAAALLAQQHPGWKADQLKATLMGAAVVNTALSGYQQGSGRVDLTRAIAQTVTTVPASIGLGKQLWPHADDAPIGRALTYRNTGTAAVTLTIRFDITGPDGRPAPAGMFTTSATALTVPAGGEATTTITVDTRITAPDGIYSGRVVASGGTTVLGTPVAVEREVESYQLTINSIDRRGAPAEVSFTTVFTPDRPTEFFGSGTLRLPSRGYDLAATVLTGDGSGPTDSMTNLVTRVALTADRTITLDARWAKPVDVLVPRASARLVDGGIGVSGVQDGYTYQFTSGAHDSFGRNFIAHIGQSLAPDRLTSFVYGAWAEPGPAGDFVDSPYVYNLAWFSPGRMFDGLVRRPRDSELAAVRNEYPTPPGRTALKSDIARLAGAKVAVPTNFTDLQFALPATRTEYYTADSVEWRSEVVRFHDSDVETFHGATWRSFVRGPQREQWGVGVLGPALPTPFRAADWVRQSPETLSFDVPMYSDANPNHFGYAFTDTAHTTLFVNGVATAQSDQAGYINYDAPPVASNIRVDTTATQSIFDTSTMISASWRFRTGPPTGPEPTVLPAMVVRYLPAEATPGGRPYLLPVTVQRQPGAAPGRVASLTVDVSYDDGRTWKRVNLVRNGAGWLAPVVHPRDGYVSLRAKAVDEAGNSVEQTIIRAYRVL